MGEHREDKGTLSFNLSANIFLEATTLGVDNLFHLKHNKEEKKKDEKTREKILILFIRQIFKTKLYNNPP